MHQPTYFLSAALRQLHFITPRGIVAWVRAFLRDGVSLMTLLGYAATIYPQREALLYEGQSLTYLFSGEGLLQARRASRSSLSQSPRVGSPLASPLSLGDRSLSAQYRYE